MKPLCRPLFIAAGLIISSLAQGQVVPPIDHVLINDPRIFDISNLMTVYELADGPVASGELSLVQGPKGSVAGSIMIEDDHLNMWGPIPLTGKLKVGGTLPLSLKLAGGGKGLPKVRITGNYDAPLQLMRVVVVVKTPEGLTYQWNDAFVPEFADNTGIAVTRVSVATNARNIIKGTHGIEGPGLLASLKSLDRERPNSDFQLKLKGVNVFGDYNPGLNQFSVSSSKASIGYGNIFTPGSLVTVTSDNLFPRIF